MQRSNKSSKKPQSANNSSNNLNQGAGWQSVIGQLKDSNSRPGSDITATAGPSGLNPAAVNISITDTKLNSPDSPLPISVAQHALRGLFVTAVGVDVLYSAFMWQSVEPAITEAFQAFGKPIPPSAQEYIRYFAIPFVLANLKYDMTAVDPVREADEYWAAMRKKKESQTQTNAPQITHQQIIRLVFNLTLQLLAILANYPVGASADAIPVAALINQHVDDKSLASGLQYSTLGFLIVTGTIYYMMLCSSKITEHVDAFIGTMKNLPEFGSKLWQYPWRNLEVIIQTLTNTFYRSTSFAFITEDIAKEIFPFIPAKRITVPSAIAAVSTGIICLFSRTLSTHKQFLNSDFDLLTAEEKDKASGWCKAFVLDILLSLIRGGAVGVLLEEIVPEQHFPLNYIVPLAGTALTILHGVNTRYVARRDQNALKTLPQEELEQRRKAKAEKTHLKEDKVGQQESLVQASPNESTRLLLDADKKATVSDLSDEMLKYYNQIVARQQGITTSDSLLGGTIIMTQLLRFIAFSLFVNTLNSSFGLGLTPPMLAAITLILGTGVALNDGAFYFAGIKDTEQHYAARRELLADRENNPNRASVSCFNSGFFAAATRPVRATLTGPTEFSLSELKACAAKTSPKIEEITTDEPEIPTQSTLV